MEQEIIFHSRLRCVNVLLTDIYDRPVHMHSDFELLYILSGAGCVTDAGCEIPVQPDSLVLLNSGDAHAITASDAPLKTLVVQFSNHFLREYDPRMRTLLFQESNVGPLLPDRARKLLLRCAVRFLEQDGTFALDCVAALAALLSILLRHIPHTQLSDREYTQRKQRAGRLFEVLTYIEENYQRPIRLQDAAALVGVTPTHLSHQFTRQTGTTFQSHLTAVRMSHAAQLLAAGGGTLTDIAAECGFSELKYMTKACLTLFGMEPRAYRARLRAGGQIGAQEILLSDEDALACLRQWTSDQA